MTVTPDRTALDRFVYSHSLVTTKLQHAPPSPMRSR
jgi:hypothetical protein